MPDDPHSRDTALARLLAQALSRSKSGQIEQSLACPDAEILATYAEHGLTDEQAAGWESHFADCGRCQKIIAVLAASGDELTDAEVGTLGTLAAASAVRRPVAGNLTLWRRSIWRGPALWRWLVPVAGVASAAGLWFALHQAAPRGTLSAQKIAATTEARQGGAAQGDAAVSSAKPDETQIAQSNLPAPPALAPPPENRLRDKETESIQSAAAAKKEQAPKQESSPNAVQAAPASNARRAIETREDDAKDSRLQSPQPAEPKSERSDALSAEVPEATAASPPPPPPPPPPPAPAAAPSLAAGVAGGERAERQSLDRAAGAAGAPAPEALKAFAQAANPSIVFASPNRRALWRLGSAGRIEHSTDQGQSWQPQSSGVTADLLAGAAPSETVAWAAGRNGTMLRTEDGGGHWQRVAAPTPTESAAFTTAAPDWVGIEATDTLHATITSRDLRRFATEDGGRTWVQLQ